MKRSVSTRYITFFLFAILLNTNVLGQNAKISEYSRTFLTYPFADPNPVAVTGKIYPYYRFDGYATTGVNREWKIVELENEWIKVLVAPEMGGKILGGIEKSTGHEFLYLNKVVKFRDIAMRGAWTSGGIEFNFGSIGHAPTTASPVDYMTRNNPDGSVSCIVGAMDLTSRTEWRVEIRLPKDKAWVETNFFWYNPMNLTTSKYHWATAAADASPDLTYYFPGDHYIGHDGDAHPWPVQEDGRNLAGYVSNDYGSDHSYHVLGTYTDFFGGYYKSRNFGFGHWNDYTQKPGKKIWIWALSPQGAIWTDLLTDQPGNIQYTEIQTGLLFNQEAAGSTFTPFKHLEFPGNSCERFSERWFPVLGTQGITEIGEAGILYINDGKSPGDSEQIGEIRFCPLDFINDTLVITDNEKQITRIPVTLKPLELFVHASTGIGMPASVSLAKGGLKWSVNSQTARNSNRPVVSPPFDWNSVQGLYLRALEFSRQREYSQAREQYRKCLSKDPHYIQALTGLAEEYVRILKPHLAAELVLTALSYDTYSPHANYLLGVIRQNQGVLAVRNGKQPDEVQALYEAREAFGIATRSMEYRSAAYTGLAEIALILQKPDQVLTYSGLALDYNRYNVKALQLQAIACRLQGNSAEAERTLELLSKIDPLNHFARFERYLLTPVPEQLNAFQNLIRNEFPEQTYLELAIGYHNLNLMSETRQVLDAAPEQAEIQYWRNFTGSGKQSLLKLSGPTHLVFPYRPETLRVLEWAESLNPAWQNRYYAALIYLSVDDSSKARELLNSCRDEPQEYHFYLTRAKVFENSDDELVIRDLQKAISLSPGEWRSWHALNGYYAKKKAWSYYLETTRKATAKVPGHMILTFDQAKAELYNRNYEESADILNNITLLPAEGAQEGHLIYRYALILKALDNFRQQKYMKALTDLTKAREWPENLGVGKPYSTDERVEDYLTALCYLQLNRTDEAGQHFQKVLINTADNKPAYDSPYLLAAMSYKMLNREAEGDRVLTNWMKSQPANPLMLWSVAMYTGNQGASQKALQRMGWKPEETPWGIGDPQLPLVYEIMSRITVR